jgi:signal transduction histidine kinase
MLTENPADPLILLVEDDSGHVGAIQRSFQAAPGSYRLETAASLHAAREAFDRFQPALVLTDYRLPDGKGSELVSLTHEACPVVLMTARGSEQIAVQALKAGVQDYVVKSAGTFARMPETVGHALKAWTLVQAHRQAEEALRCYARRLVEMEENLRKKLATELHDEIARDLTVLGMNLSIISSTLADVAPKTLHVRIEESGRLIEDISRTTRNIMAGLRPPVLDDYGLVSALRWHSELFSARGGVNVSVQDSGLFPRLPPEVELALFRVAQEALMNTAKHAAAKSVTITLDCDQGRVRFTIADDGQGFIPPAVFHPRVTGWGMIIMRERAELVGGHFTVDSQPGQGTVVTVDIRLEGM